MNDPFNIYKSQTVGGEYIPATTLTPDQRKKIKTRAAPGRKLNTKPLYARKVTGVKDKSKLTLKSPLGLKVKVSPEEIADASNSNWRKYSRMRKPDLARTHTKVRRNVYVDPKDSRAVKAAKKMPKMRRPTVVASGSQSNINMVANSMNTGSKSSPRLITVGDNPLLDIPDKKPPIRLKGKQSLRMRGSEVIYRQTTGDAKRLVTHEAIHANTKRNLYKTGKLVSNQQKLAMEEGRADAGRLKRVGHMRMPSYGFAGRTGGATPVGVVNGSKNAKAYRVGRRLAGKPIMGPKHIGIPLAVGAAGVMAADQRDKRKTK